MGKKDKTDASIFFWGGLAMSFIFYSTIEAYDSFSKYINFIIIAIGLLIALYNYPRYSRESKIKIKKRQKKVEEEEISHISKVTNELGMNIDKIIGESLLLSTKICGSRLIIDDQNEMLLVWPQLNNNDYKIIKYNELLEFKLVQDDETTLSSNSLKTIAGGLALGSLGALAGATSKRKNKKYCTSLKIVLYINDLNTATIELPIIIGKTLINSSYFKERTKIAEEMLGALKYIQNKNNN